MGVFSSPQPGVVFWLATARTLIRAGRAPELRLWLAMHHLARAAGGPGWVPYDTPTIEYLAELTGCAAITCRQLVKKGGDGLWTRSGGIIRLAGQARVSTALSVDDFEDRCELPVGIFAAGLEEFCAAIFATWVSHRGDLGVRLVWDDLTALWGHSRGQLRRWIAASGVHRTDGRGYASYPEIDADNLPDPEPDQVGFNHGKMVAFKGQAYWAFRRANTLRCGAVRLTVHGGKAAKVNRAKARAGKDTRAHSIIRCAVRSRGLEGNLQVTAGTRALLDEIDLSTGGLSANLAAIRDLLNNPRSPRRNFRDYKSFHYHNRKFPERDAFWRIWAGLAQYRPVEMWIYRAPSEVIS